MRNFQPAIAYVNLDVRDEIAREAPHGRMEASRVSDLHWMGETSGNWTAEIQQSRDHGSRSLDRGTPNKSNTWTHLDAEIEIKWWEKARS